MKEHPKATRRVRFQVFRRGIARRILSLFILSALLPLFLFAALSLSNVTNQLERQAEERLRQSCKDAGMDLVERLYRLQEDLALALGDPTNGTLDGFRDASEDLHARLTNRFAWIALGTAEGAALDSTGEGIELPSLSREERTHLEERPTAAVIRRRPERAAAVILVFMHAPGRYVFGEAQPSYLWQRASKRGAATDFMVLAEGGELLFSTSEQSGLETSLAQAVRSGESSGHLEWGSNGAPQFAGYRKAYTRPQFYNSFILANSQPRELVLAPVETFKKIFLLSGVLTLCLVTMASVIQIRRSLVPIVLLQEGTRRLASGSSDEQVVIDSNDEFEDLAGSFNSMANAIRERTSELERANRAKANFLANMSHEIRTPMNAVLGYSELALAEGVSETERLEYIDVIHRNGKHLLGVINGILDMSRVEAGQVVAHVEDCEAPRAVSGVVELLEVTAKKKGIELVLVEDPAVPATVRTDAQRLRQILFNVVGNAVKYTERGRVQVETSWRRAADGDREVLSIRVQDSGPGIPPEKLEHIFKAFYQADTSMSRRHGGTGLGLSLSRTLARLLGGDVTCQSEPGRGSTFTVTIAPEPGTPRSMIRGPKQPAYTEDQPEADSKSHARGSHRILLVEDVPVNRKLVSTLLKRAGFEVVEAENGRLGMDRARAAHEDGRPFAVILMDMQMPVMDGYEATRNLRDLGYRAPIIALTAHSFEGERERCLEAGCDDYATKPIDNKTLIGIVDRYVSDVSFKG